MVASAEGFFDICPEMVAEIAKGLVQDDKVKRFKVVQDGLPEEAEVSRFKLLPSGDLRVYLVGVEARKYLPKIKCIE